MFVQIPLNSLSHCTYQVEESKYRLTCLTGIRNKQCSFIRQSQGCHNSSREDNMTQAKVFVELLKYIDNCRENDGTSIFKFSKLHQMYEHRLRNLGINKVFTNII